MHLVLCLEEILLNIFGHCHDSSLVKLARTCRTFKEPALDVLWNALIDLTPLVRCLPKSLWVQSGDLYSFKRHLKEAEWHIILGYTRRVRGLHLIEGSPGLAWSCVKELSKPPPSTVIFPKLSNLQLLWHSLQKIAPFIQHLANSELKRLFLAQPRYLRDVVDAFGEGSPNVEGFWFLARTPHYAANTHTDTISKALCRWTKLTSVSCSAINLTVETLSHLSRRNLRYLAFCPDDAVNHMQSTPSGTPMLSFSPLSELSLSSQSLTSIGRFFDYVHFPGLEILCLALHSRPTMPAFESFFMALRGACGLDTLKTFTLEVVDSGDDEDEGEHEDWNEDEDDSEDEDEDYDESEDDEDNEEDQSSNASFVRDSTPFSITFQCISPLTAFENLRSVTFDTPSPVDLNEQQFLLLASSWPRLEKFSVGESCESSVITPGGFLQLLERCRLLRKLDIMFDTRGYEEILQGHPWRGLTMPEGASISLLHSSIEEESVEALGIFFHVAPFPNFRLETHWNDYSSCSDAPREIYDLMGYTYPIDSPGSSVYSKRWEKVFSLAQNMWEERRKLRHSLETQI
ncbi:hypothetical protein JVU11DRAFT_7333 [Chiua virens]|nr:hypothetical protein JVU11DRAFT_7333 [Chiua virens]